jgi:hypothetical protein
MKTRCATLITDDMVRREMERCRALFGDVGGAVHIGQENRRHRDPRIIANIPIRELLSQDSPILYDQAIRNLMKAEGKPRIHYSVDFVEGRLVSAEHYETEFGSGVFEAKPSE